MAALSPRQKHGFYNVTFHKGTSNLHNSLNKLNGTRAANATVHRLRHIQTHFYKNNNNQKVNIITTRQSGCRRVFLQSNVPHLYQRLEERRLVVLHTSLTSVSDKALASSDLLNV